MAVFEVYIFCNKKNTNKHMFMHKPGQNVSSASILRLHSVIINCMVGCEPKQSIDNSKLPAEEFVAIAGKFNIAAIKL